ncbi:zinc finger protein weckle-like [Uranotaenia lowii]|uniref:zinc finger protein weckle-like n=1 Tax=Uranotaenia lowii TaxID=190385 RepID=UPI002478571F|nr:zinc finger protein weckle-like [Uranotaenia lowii]
MPKSWKNWCRLCANECAVYKLESLEELNDIVRRHFQITLQELPAINNCICEDCYNFVNKLENFRESLLQSGRLLQELSLCEHNNQQLLNSDILDLRFRFLSDSLIAVGSELPEPNESYAPAENFLHEISSDQEDQDILENEADTPEPPQFVELTIEKVTNVRKIKKEPPELTVNPFKRTLEGQEAPEEKYEILDNLSSEQLAEQDTHSVVKGESDEYNQSGKASQEFLEKESLSNEKTISDSNPVKQQMKTKPTKPKTRIKTLHYCKACDKHFKNRSLYSHHMQTDHTNSEELKYGCEICPKKFSTERSAKLHAVVHLPDEQKLIHPCEYCDKKFSKLVNVYAHIKAVHNKERLYVCEECGKALVTKGALKEHKLTHSDDQPFQCSCCSKSFKNLARLKIHEDTHNDTLYVCPHCGLKLNTKRTLKMHMVVHSDQKRFKCQYCGNEYKRSKALKNHLILHTGLRPYQCPFCEKTFANGSNCRSHKKKAHPKELAALEAAGGGQKWVNNIPKLEELLRPHQSASPTPDDVQQGTSTTATSALLQELPTLVAAPSQTAPPPPPLTVSPVHQHQKGTVATVIATPLTPSDSTAAASIGDELVLPRGVRLVTAYFHSEPPPLNMLSKKGIKNKQLDGGSEENRRQRTLRESGKDGEQVQLAMPDMVGLPLLQLINPSDNL